MDNLTLINTETDRFIAALGQVDADAPVPTCPEWTAGDLLWHLTVVHAFWAEILRSGARTDEEFEAVEGRNPQRLFDRDETIALLIDETSALVAELAAREDSEPAWSSFPSDQTVGFTRRMQVHEATMHRVDAELTAGLVPTPIPHEVAADGIAHGVEVMWGWWGTNPGFSFTPSAGIVQLVTTDGGTWLIAGGRWRGVGSESGRQYDEPGAVLVESGDPAATITGTAEELYRWLWGRGDEPASSGDAASLDALREAQSQGMQGVDRRW